MSDGGPAFPSKYKTRDSDGYTCTHVEDGMSLRDYFAAQALGALIAAYDTANTAEGSKSCIGTDHILRNVPALAYKFADAMLKARER